MLGKIPAARLALIEKIVAHALKSVPRRAARADPGIPRRASSAASPKKTCARIVPRTWPPPRSPTWNSAAGAPAIAVLVDIAPPLAADAPTASHRSLLRVVAPDMPFLVDSIGIVFSQMNIAVHLIVHPCWRCGAMRAARSRRSASTGALRSSSPGRCWRSTGRATPRRPRELERRVRAVARRRATGGRRFSARCSNAVRAVANELDRAPLPVPKSHASEARALLAWMHDGHFVFLGYRYYRLKRGRSRDALVRDGASGLGILRGFTQGPTQVAAAHRAHGASAPAGTRARAARAHQGQHAVHRASRKLSRLRRREDLRRRRPGDPASIASSACGLRAPITSHPRRSRCCAASSTR